MPGVEKASAMEKCNNLFLEASPLLKFTNIDSTVAGKNATAQVAALLKEASFLKEVDLIINASKDPRKKDLEKAMALKAEGNAHFKENRFREARDAYTAALQNCPFNEKDTTDNREYAILLANRSAALDSGRFYAAAVQDIDLAFKCGYPKNLQFKIYKRKGHALLKLKQYVDSKAAYTKCLDMIGKSDMNSKLRDETRARTKKHMNVFTVVKKLNNQPMEDKPKVNLEEGDEGNAELKGASAKVTLCEEKGLQATQEIEPEMCLLREPFYAAVLNDGPQQGQMCPQSFEHMPGPQPCSFGSGELFVSDAARAAANATWQKYEWTLREDVKRLGLTPTARLALRILTTVDGVKADNPALALFDLKKNKNSNKKSDKGEKAAVVVLAAVLVKLLRAAKYPFGEGLEEETICEQAFRAVSVAEEFAVPLTVPKPLDEKAKRALLSSDGDDFPTSELGIGIFPAFSRMLLASKSSDGEPEAFSYTAGCALVVQSGQKIASGGSICLKAAPKMEVINEMVTFRCSREGCKVGFPLKENTKEKVIRCPMEECGKETNVWLKLKRMTELKGLHSQAREKFEKKGDFSEAKKNFLYLVGEWEKVVHRPYKEIDGLERDFRITARLMQINKENDWLQSHS